LFLDHPLLLIHPLFTLFVSVLLFFRLFDIADPIHTVTMATISKDDLWVPASDDGYSYDHRDEIFQLPWMKEELIKADMYVDLSECGGCEPLDESYGVTWTKWLLGKNETAYDMYERCRRIDDNPNDCAEQCQQLELMCDGAEPWKDGVKDFVRCKQDPLWDETGVAAAERNDLAQCIYRAYKYGAFRGICGNPCCSQDMVRLAEFAACLIHCGYKCLRDGEKQVHEIWADNQHLSKAMVTVAHMLMYTCSDAMVPNRCCDKLNAAMHRAAGAHFLMAYGSPLYNKGEKGECHRQWSLEGVSFTECLHVLQSLRTVMFFLDVGQSGMAIVDRIMANVCLWRPNVQGSTTRVYGLLVNDVITPHFAARMRNIADAYCDCIGDICASERAEVLLRLGIWGQTYTSQWRAGMRVGDELRELPFVGAVMGVLRERKTQIETQVVDNLYKTAVNLARLGDTPRDMLLKEMLSRAVAMRTRRGMIAKPQSIDQYVKLRGIDGVWELTGAVMPFAGPETEKGLCLPVVRAIVAWFNCITDRNRTDVRACENEFLPVGKCTRCELKDLVVRSTSHIESIGVYQANAWGGILYSTMGVEYECYIRATPCRIIPGAARALATCRHCGDDMLKTEQHNVFCTRPKQQAPQHTPPEMRTSPDRISREP
jgi:hypothetical protein